MLLSLFLSLQFRFYSPRFSFFPLSLSLSLFHFDTSTLKVRKNKSSSTIRKDWIDDNLLLPYTPLTARDMSEVSPVFSVDFQAFHH